MRLGNALLRYHLGIENPDDLEDGRWVELVADLVFVRNLDRQWQADLHLSLLKALSGK